MQLKNKHIVVAGLGKSGLAAARFCRQTGARVLVSDAGAPGKLQTAIQTLQAEGIEFQGGPHQPQTFAQADLVVLSPGISHTIDAVEAARQAGVPIWGELELACRQVTLPLVAVTGTNGKTTTCRWIADMLERSGKTVFVGGNIGTPLIDLASQRTSVDVGVVEVSSFQLDTAHSFHPRVAVWLNTAPDHMDRYPNMQAYAESKARLFAHLTAEDHAVINGEDRLACELVGDTPAEAWVFGDQVQPGCWQRAQVPLQDTRIVVTGQESALEVDLGQIRLPGRHNLENACAAALSAYAAGASSGAIQASLNDFKGLSHRLQSVARVGNVEFYNDSKATNVAAVVQALASFDHKVVLILGGRNKGIDLGDLTTAIITKTKALVAIGESQAEVIRRFGGLVPVYPQPSMTAAVSKAFDLSRPQGSVLLAPACASFDMFDSYVHRGEVFCEAVQALAQRNNCHVTP